MGLQVTFVSEFVAADLALKWTLPSVSSVVILKLTVRLETFLADVTNEPEHHKNFMLFQGSF